MLIVKGIHTSVSNCPLCRGLSSVITADNILKDNLDYMYQEFCCIEASMYHSL